MRRLRAKQDEKSRYVKLYAQGHMDEEELEVHLADLKYQVDNLKLVAARTEAWLMTLRKNLAKVEQDTEEAFEKRRELVKLPVERITTGGNEDGRPKVVIICRFEPPEASPREDGSAVSGRDSEEFSEHTDGAAEKVCCAAIPG